MSDGTEATGTADDLRAQLHAAMANPLMRPACRWRAAQRIDALERTLRAPDAHNAGDDRALSRR